MRWLSAMGWRSATRWPSATGWPSATPARGLASGKARPPPTMTYWEMAWASEAPETANWQ